MVADCNDNDGDDHDTEGDMNLKLRLGFWVHGARFSVFGNSLIRLAMADSNDNDGDDDNEGDINPKLQVGFWFQCSRFFSLWKGTEKDSFLMITKRSVDRQRVTTSSVNSRCSERHVARLLFSFRRSLVGVSVYRGRAGLPDVYNWAILVQVHSTPDYI